MADGKRHPQEQALLDFCRSQEPSYIKRTAEWVKEKYPDSVPSVLPKLRQLYREKTR